jgi:uncharacterized protein (TIGR03000 family)
MYSMVLMAALSTGGDLPACHRGGCGGCWGGCYGCWGGCYGCCGCWGGCWGCYGCYGCWGCYGCYGGWGYSAYAAPAPYQAAPAQQMSPAPESIAPPKREGATFRTPTPTSARLIVELPANAKLFVDDQPMKTTSTRRAFRTPTLEPGQSYYYMLRAELVHDGKTVQQTKKVVVRAGEEIRANFPSLEQIQTAEIGAQAKR